MKASKTRPRISRIITDKSAWTFIRGNPRKSAAEKLMFLCQVEQQNFSVFCAFDGQLLLVADRGAVALVELLAVEFD